MNPSFQPVRVLHLNSMLTGGGTDDQCIKLAAELRKRGHDVWLAGPADTQLAPVVEQLAVPFIDTGARAGKFAFIRRAAEIIRSKKIQIVHGHHGRDLWPTILAARLAGTRPKIVLTRHMAKSPSSWASRNFLLGQCDALIAVSEFVARVLREGVYEPQSPEEERRMRPPIRGDYSKIKVVYGGIDTAKFAPANASSKRRELGLEPDHYAFAVVGGFDSPRGKGQREFLAAAAKIYKEAPLSRFLIIGRGTMAETLKDDIERLGLGGKAWLTGQATDMPQVMNAIDCLVHPQIGTEALGLVICEAHACGKAVIASNLDGIPEAFRAGDHGRLVAPENVDELAEAMRLQAGEARLNAADAEKLHARVAGTFSLAIMTEKTERLYAGLLHAS